MIIVDRKWIKVIVDLLLLVLLVAGCRSDKATTDVIVTSPLPQHTISLSPIATPDTRTPNPDLEQKPTAVSPGKGAIVGTVLDQDGKKLPPSVNVFLATFYWNDNKTQGVFLLDPDRGTRVPIANSGLFKFVDIKPGYYVVLVGETPATAVAILGNNNQARVVEVGADQIVDLGKEHVNLP